MYLAFTRLEVAAEPWIDGLWSALRRELGLKLLNQQLDELKGDIVSNNGMATIANCNDGNPSYGCKDNPQSQPEEAEKPDNFTHDIKLGTCNSVSPVTGQSAAGKEDPEYLAVNTSQTVGVGDVPVASESHNVNVKQPDGLASESGPVAYPASSLETESSESTLYAGLRNQNLQFSGCKLRLPAVPTSWLQLQFESCDVRYFSCSIVLYMRPL